MKPLTVHVRAAHIAAGRPGSVSHGPVALAMSEATGCTCYVSGVAVSVPGRFYCPVPAWLLSLLDDFDRFGAMEPFTFALAGEPRGRRLLPEQTLPDTAPDFDSAGPRNGDTR